MANKDTKNTTNRGIQQYAGTMNVGIQAVGDGANAQGGTVYLGYPTVETNVAHLLTTMQELIQQHQDALPEPINVATTTEILNEELSNCNKIIYPIE